MPTIQSLNTIIYRYDLIYAAYIYAHFSFIPLIDNDGVCGSRIVMFNLLLQSVLLEFDHNLAVSTSRTKKVLTS
jgi:hypothetical protein